MNAHRIEVFDRADDDAIVRVIADDFHFILFPAQNRFFDQNFGRRRSVEAAFDNLEEFLTVIGNAAAGAAEREGGADDRGQANHVERLCCLCKRMAHIALLALHFAELPFGFKLVERLVQFVAGELRLHLRALDLVALAVLILDFSRIGEHRARRVEADLLHGFAEERAVFGLVDSFGLGADHLDVITFKHAHAAQGKRGVERGLSAHRRQDRVRALLGDDLGDDFRRDRLDIGCIRQIGIGHDRGRVGVDEDDAIAFLFQRLAGLSAGIVEFASLADDNGARADNQDRFDICTFRHGRSSYLRSRMVWPGNRVPLPRDMLS